MFGRCQHAFHVCRYFLVCRFACMCAVPVAACAPCMCADCCTFAPVWKQSSFAHGLFSGVSLSLLELELRVKMAASVTVTESESAASVPVLADTGDDLWLQLPVPLRAELYPEGNFTDLEIIDALCLDSNDRREFLHDYAYASDADDLAWLCLVFGQLQACVAGRAKLRRKRRACLDLAFQYLEVNRHRKRAMCAAAPDTTQWLVSLSGAWCSSRHLCLPKSRLCSSDCLRRLRSGFAWKRLLWPALS